MKMKKVLLALVVLAGIASSCKYDDGELWDNVNDLSNRVTSLEAATKQINSDIAAMQSIISALQNKVYVSKVEDLEDGYTIHFTDGTKATIKNGADGKDGVNGADGKDGVDGTDGKDGKDGVNAPVINVKQDGGVYYWTITVDGKTEWLTDEDGNKLRVSGEDGEDGKNGASGSNGKNGNTPLLKVSSDGYWMVSYDNGADYEYVKDVNGNKVLAEGKNGSNGDSQFEDITEGEGVIIIKLTDGTEYELAIAASVIYKDEQGKEVSADGISIITNGSITLTYDVPLLGSNYSVEVLKEQGVSVSVGSDNTLEINPNGMINAKAVVIYYNATQTITSVLTFKEVYDGSSKEEVKPENGVYVITNPSQLASLSAKVLTSNDSNVETVTIELQNDIDMGGAEFSSIIVNYSDKLIFKGNGNTISNINIVSGEGDNNTGQAGMFYGFGGSTIEVSDLILKDITVTSDENSFGYTAAVVGYCESTAILDNVDVVNATVIGVKSSGLLAGHLSGTLQAKDCDLNGTVTLKSFSGEPDGHYAGKYVGTIAGVTSLTDCTMDATVSGNLKSDNVGDIYGRMVSGSLNVNGAQLVYTCSQLQTALNNATTDITLSLGADITGDLTIQEKDNVKITIIGNNHNLNGAITINGNSSRNKTAGLTISNVNFNATSISTDACINLGGNDGIRYTDNVTVKDCTFSVADKVAIKSYTGGDHYLSVIGCTVNEGMHSMLQITNVEVGLVITDCKVYSKNGINLNNTPSFEMSGCTFETTGYAIRVGVAGNVNTDAKTFTVSSSTLKSACDDGDAVIMFRDNATYSTLTLTNTTVTGTTKISGRTNATTINGTY